MEIISSWIDQGVVLLNSSLSLGTYCAKHLGVFENDKVLACQSKSRAVKADDAALGCHSSREACPGVEAVARPMDEDQWQGIAGDSLVADVHLQAIQVHKV